MGHFRERFSHASQMPREESPFPQLPPSLEPVHQRSEPAPVVHTILPYNTPYLGLRARLSQVWLNRWTILLLLILVRVLLASTSLNDDLKVGRREALSACTAVESMGSAMASMPHYMARGVNEMAASGIEHAVAALQKTLLLGMKAIEEIAIFVVHLMIGTYVCLITFAIKSSLGTVLDATEDIMKGINSTLNKVTSEIKDISSGFTDKLNSWADKLNGALSSLFGSDNAIPELNLDKPLDALTNIKIPSKVTDALNALQSKIPTFEEAQGFIDDGIRLPFQTIRNLVNDSLTVYEFDRSVFPVPEKEALTFCSDNPHINDFFNHLTEIVVKAKNIVIGVTIALAILVMIPMGIREVRRYRIMRQRAYMLTAHGQEFDPVDIVQIASRPYTSTIGLKAATVFKSSRRQILVRWFFAYITSTTALFVLALGIAGLLSALGQYVLLRVVQVQVPALANQVGEFANIVVDKLEDASMAWAVATNGAINQTSDELNENIFGWVQNGTTTINNTLNFFVDTMSEGIDTAFGGTPLEEPVKQIVRCLVEIKVEGIQKGLTWANEHAQISLPTLPNDTFSLGAAQSVGPDASSGGDSFLADKTSAAADKITNVVVRISEKWQDHITKEALISAGLVGIWLIVCLIGAIRTCVMLMAPGKTRGEGGEKVYTGEPRQRFTPHYEEKGRGYEA